MNPCAFFEEILKIPRESGNEQQIADYLCSFAKENNLEYYRDDANNVIIKRKSNCNAKETIILQDHTDMVCTSDSNYDFKNNGIPWYIEDGYYKAKGTTLGADNGIGCSLILAILANKEIKIPNIEAIFTVQEETTMLGAKKLDYSKVTGNKLISIDGTSEGIIDVSCAGMASINISKKYVYEKCDKKAYTLRINGLKGGHSGTDIDKNRGNAIKIISEILHNFPDIQLIMIKGGSKENVIPSNCECIFMTNSQVIISDEYKARYPSINIELITNNEYHQAISVADTNIILNFLCNLPIEVLTYNDNNTPKTSINLGVINTLEDSISIDVSIRSSDKEEETHYIKLVSNLASNLDFKLIDCKPFFGFVKNSLLRDKLVNNYEKLYNKNITLEHIHAGLEGGIFKEHIKDLDICVISPNLYDIHSTKERVEIASVNRVYKWLIATLEDLT